MEALRERLEQARINGKEPFDDGTLENIEECWTMLLDEYPYTISGFNNDQLSTLARLLLTSTRFDENNVPEGTRITSKVVQHNERLVIRLIFEIFVGIVSRLEDCSSVTKALLTEITRKSWESRRMEKILEACKKLLKEPEWIENEEGTSITVVRYLQILLLLPLVHLNTEMNTVIFLVAFTISKEWTNSTTIVDLCAEVLSDVTENSKIDILQYIQPQFFIGDLSKHVAITRVLQCSLSKIENYDLISNFIKSHKSVEDCGAPTIVECLEKSKSKLKPDEKLVARRIKKKLCKRILDSLQDGITKSYQVKSLTVAAKAAIAMRKIDEPLLKAIHFALTMIFGVKEKKNDDLIVNEGLQLIKIVLQHRNDIPVDNKVIKQTWELMLKNPSADIVFNLLGITVPETLQKILNSLQKQTVDALRQGDECLFEKSLSIWCCVSRVDVGARSNNIRQKHLQTVMQHFVTAKMSHNNCLNALKLCTTIITARKAHVSEENIDLILLVAIRFMTTLEDVSAALCEQELELSLAFVKFRPGVTADRLPSLLFLYRRIVRFIVDESRRKTSRYTQRQLQCLSLDANKLVVAFIKLKKDMARVSPYVIADLVEIYSEGVVPSYVKEPFDDSIGMFLSVCDHHAISLLFRALPPAMQEIFKTLYNTYTKFYKFTGKI